MDGDGALGNGNSSSSTAGKTEDSLPRAFMEAGFMETGFMAALGVYTLPDQGQVDYKMKSRAGSDAKSPFGR